MSDTLLGSFARKMGRESQTVQGYRIVKHIASGSQADVYLVTKDGETRAMKIAKVWEEQKPLDQKPWQIEEIPESQETLNRRLRQEKEIQWKEFDGTPAMENMVEILDSGCSNEMDPKGAPRYFIVMEYIPQSLFDVIQREKKNLIVSGVLKIIDSVTDLVLGESKEELQYKIKIYRGVANALRHFHRKNLVHRDIKPENILITNEGVAKVADFGLTSSGTLEGRVEGTPQYLAPEQLIRTYDENGTAVRTFKGVKEVTPKTDVFAAAVAMYELFTGRHPFYIKGDEEATLARIFDPNHYDKLAPAFKRRHPNAPRALLNIFKQSLEYNAIHRPTSEEIWTGLDEALNEVGK